jgi:hypothetical protein
MSATDTAAQAAALAQDEQEITIEILHQKNGGNTIQGLKNPLNVKVERIDRGFKIIASAARCM